MNIKEFLLRKITDLFNDLIILAENFSIELEPPYNYLYLEQLPKQEYPKYLRKIFKNKIHKKLNLFYPLTFNEKIQWLKLNDCPL